VLVVCSGIVAESAMVEKGIRIRRSKDFAFHMGDIVGKNCECGFTGLDLVFEKSKLLLLLRNGHSE
jgi:hypothetical protein